MIKTVVAGAAGRMGRRLVDNIINSEDMQLVGAFEVPGCPLMGSDAGSVACGQECGVKITTAEEGLPEGTDAVITFATGGVRMPSCENISASSATSSLAPASHAKRASSQSAFAKG